MRRWQIEHIRNNLPELIKVTRCTITLLARLQKQGLLSSDEADDVWNKAKTPQEKSKLLYDILKTRADAYDKLIHALNSERQSGATEILNNHKPNFQTVNLITVNKSQGLGKGCSGTKVLRGKFDGREVAVKLVKEDIKQAIKEVEILRNLDSHANIVRYYFAEQSGGTVYIALELCYVNLQDQVNGKILFVDQYEVLKQCAKGVAFLHDNKIIHRDLKPTNILLTLDGQVKISDFGFSKRLAMAGSLETATGVYGTRDWMAPEILKLSFENNIIATSKISATADIFALGCVFYFVLTSGQHPFGEPWNRTYNILTHKHGVTLSKLDDRWKDIISSMISELPNSRPASDNLMVHFERPSASWKKARHRHNSVNALVEVENPTHTCTVRPQNNIDIFEPGINQGASQFCRYKYGYSLLLNAVTTKNFEVFNYIYSIVDSSKLKTFIDAGTLRSVYKCESIFDIVRELIENQIGINAVDSEGNNLLAMAVIERKDVDQISDICQLGLDPKLTNKYNQSLIHLAVQAKTLSVIGYLVHLGIDINGRDKDGRTPLLYSTKINFVCLETLPGIVRHGSSVNEADHIENSLTGPPAFIETVQKLVEHGADVNAVDSLGNNLFGLAILEGKTPKELSELCKLEINHGHTNQNRQTAFHLAAAVGNFSVAGYLKTIGLDIEERDASGNTPLLCSRFATNNFLQTVCEFRKLGADMNAVDTGGNNVFSLAVLNGKNAKELSELRKLGINPVNKNKNGHTALHLAAAVGNFTVASYLKNIGLNIEECDASDNTALLCSRFTTKNFLQTVCEFKKLGADINAVDTGGNNLFSLAMLVGKDVDELSQIVQEGVIPNQSNKAGRTPLHLAAVAGSFSFVGFMISQGLDVHEKLKDGYTPLLCSSVSKCFFVETVEKLIKHGANVNDVDSNGNNLLCLAVLKGRTVEELSRLLKLEINFAHKNQQGRNALHLAAENGNVSVIEYLLSVGLDIHTTDEYNETALLRSTMANCNFMKTVQVLAKNSAIVEDVDSFGNNLFALAALRGRNVKDLSQLISLGVSPLQKNLQNKTSFHLAAQGGNFRVIGYLKSIGLNINERNRTGRTPIHFACFAKSYFFETVKALLDNGSDINVIDKEGNNIVLVAVLNNRSIEEMDTLIRYGANWKIVNKLGKSVLHIAAELKRICLFEYFLKNGADLYVLDNAGKSFAWWGYRSKTLSWLIVSLLRFGKTIKKNSEIGKQILDKFETADIQNGDSILAEILADNDLNPRHVSADSKVEINRVDTKHCNKRLEQKTKIPKPSFLGSNSTWRRASDSKNIRSLSIDVKTP